MNKQRVRDRGGGVSSSYSANWSTYDGSDNGSLGLLHASALRGHYATAPISGNNSKLLAFYAYGDPTIVMKAGIITRTGLTAAIGAEVQVDANWSGTPCIVALSSTRFLAAAVTNDNARINVYLLNYDGSTITIVDSDEYAGDTANGGIKITAHSSTLAAILYSDVTTDDCFIMTVSISGDALTLNAPVEVKDSVTATDDIDIVALSATSGLFSHKNLVTLYTISGTTPSAGDPERLVSGETDATGNTPHGLCKINGSSTKALVVFDDGASGVKAKVITNGSGTLASGATTQINDGDNSAFTFFLRHLKDNYYIVAVDIQADDPEGQIIVLSHNTGDDSITVVGTSNGSAAGVEIDHAAIGVFDGGDYAIYLDQDDAFNGSANVYKGEYRVVTSA